MIAIIEMRELISCRPHDYETNGVALTISSAGGWQDGGREYLNINATPDTLRKLAAELARAADAMDDKEAAKCKKAA